MTSCWRHRKANQHVFCLVFFFIITCADSYRVLFVWQHANSIACLSMKMFQINVTLKECIYWRFEQLRTKRYFVSTEILHSNFLFFLFFFFNSFHSRFFWKPSCNFLFENIVNIKSYLNNCNGCIIIFLFLVFLWLLSFLSRSCYEHLFLGCPLHYNIYKWSYFF